MVDKSRMVNDTNYKKIEEHTEKCKEILKNKTQEIIATDCSNEGINVAEKMKICWEEAKRKWQERMKGRGQDQWVGHGQGQWVGHGQGQWVGQGQGQMPTVLSDKLQH
ncbi:uncharacterized protein LOC111633462 [Centruroides sculpturatus]|uniref:uncharacterized protein LOC111633462 n=1 Tax=Centruroides sculpturatus TaxID=218467 RepID=UPI000C6CD5BD|nr:uncharacterized protein LOC111633462 [Centruroides sculpturatus]